MKRRRLRSMLSVFALTALLQACGEEVTNPDPDPDPVPGTPTITISLLRLALAVGSPAQLTVVATDADGNVVANPSVSYASSDDQVVTVNATGEATAVAVGTANITATFDGVSDMVPVGIVASAFFANDVAPIFNSNCAVSGCHVAPNPAQNMDLSSAQSYAALVDVRANQVSFDRVEPGDPDGSYVIHKLEGLNGVTQMPLNRTPLPQDAIDVVRAWIQDGAQNN
jgi:hypothetical protein